jgi:hypothetical protein
VKFVLTLTNALPVSCQSVSAARNTLPFHDVMYAVDAAEIPVTVLPINVIGAVMLASKRYKLFPALPAAVVTMYTYAPSLNSGPGFEVDESRYRGIRAVNWPVQLAAKTPAQTNVHTTSERRRFNGIRMQQR